MYTSNLNEFKLGWIIGNFEPTLFKNEHLEIGVKRFLKGAVEPTHHQLLAHEITVVVEGEIRIGTKFFKADDIVIIPPLESASFESITDSILVCIKYPSIPLDKVLG